MTGTCAIHDTTWRQRRKKWLSEDITSTKVYGMLLLERYLNVEERSTTRKTDMLLLCFRITGLSGTYMYQKNTPDFAHFFSTKEGRYPVLSLEEDTLVSFLWKYCKIDITVLNVLTITKKQLSECHTCRDTWLCYHYYAIHKFPHKENCAID